MGADARSLEILETGTGRRGLAVREKRLGRRLGRKPPCCDVASACLIIMPLLLLLIIVVAAAAAAVDGGPNKVHLLNGPLARMLIFSGLANCFL